MSDITLVEGNNELNVKLSPLPPSPELLGHIADVDIWHEPLSTWKRIYEESPWPPTKILLDERLVEVPVNTNIHTIVSWDNWSEVE
ncbi:unnamed protein product, partial [marine sediment metagenome]